MNEQQPYLGQRCRIIEVNVFGTIIRLSDDGKEARVERDTGGSQWYEVEKIEPLATYPAI